MTLKDALGFVIDYGKFIATLWNAYIVFTVAVIGWLISMRSKDGPLEVPLRNVLIAAYLAASLIFGFVLAANNIHLVKLHRMLRLLADADPADKAVKAYLATLGTENPEPMLWILLGAFVVVALLAAWVMWFIATFTKKAPPQAS